MYELTSSCVRVDLIFIRVILVSTGYELTWLRLDLSPIQPNQSGGGHRHNYLSIDERNDVREDITRFQMFSDNKTRDKITFHQNIRRLWENLSDDKIDTFVERNKGNFLKKKK